MPEPFWPWDEGYDNIPEERETEVERIAQVLWEADCAAVSYEWADVSEGGRSKWRRLARAVLLARPR